MRVRLAFRTGRWFLPGKFSYLQVSPLWFGCARCGESSHCEHSGSPQSESSGFHRTSSPHRWTQQSVYPCRMQNGCHDSSPSRYCPLLVPSRCVHCWQGWNCGHCALGYRCRGFQLVRCVVLISDRHPSFPVFLCTATHAIKSQEWYNSSKQRVSHFKTVSWNLLSESKGNPFGKGFMCLFYCKESGLSLLPSVGDHGVCRFPLRRVCFRSARKV